MTRRQKYVWNDHRKVVQGVFHVSGRRLFRNLARYGELEGLADAGVKRLLNARHQALRGELEADPPAFARVPGRTLFSEAWQAWIEAAQATRAPGTIAYYLRTGNEYLAVNGDHPLEAFTLHHVDRYLSWMRAPRPPARKGSPPRPPLSVTSCNIRLQNLRTFLRWAHERKEIPEVPRIRELRRELRLPRVPTVGQLDAWLRRLKRIARWRPGDPPIPGPDGRAFTPAPYQRISARRREFFLRVGMDTGLRLGEFFHTPLDHYDTDARVVTVRFQPRFHVKEGKEKEIPLTRQVARLVRAVRRARPRWRYFLDDGSGRNAYATAHTFAHQLGRDLVLLGLAGRGIKRAHALRALFAKRLSDRGVDRAVIRDLMGHSDIKVTDGYLPDTKAPKAAAIAALEDG